MSERAPRLENRLKGKQVAVVGAGIAGTMAALQLLDLGCSVTIYSPIKPGGKGWRTGENPASMASEVAGASWKPYHLDFPEDATRDKVLQSSWDWNQQLMAEGIPGIYMMRHYEVSNRAPIDVGSKEYYLKIIGEDKYHVYNADEDPTHTSPIPGGFKYGLWYDTIHFDPHLALPALIKRFEERGGKFVELDGNLQDRDQLLQIPGDIILNSTGLGAKQLVTREEADKLYPEAGEIVEFGPVKWRRGETPFSMSAVPDLEIEEVQIKGLANQYGYPHDDRLISGGSGYPDALPGVREAVARFIRRGAKKIFGDRVNVNVELARRVGLRPSRKGGVRNEVEIMQRPDGSDILLAHNYGHGGAGWTTAAGTAVLIADLLNQTLQ